MSSSPRSRRGAGASRRAVDRWPLSPSRADARSNRARPVIEVIRRQTHPRLAARAGSGVDCAPRRARHLARGRRRRSFAGQYRGLEGSRAAKRAKELRKARDPSRVRCKRVRVSSPGKGVRSFLRKETHACRAAATLAMYSRSALSLYSSSTDIPSCRIFSSWA